MSTIMYRNSSTVIASLYIMNVLQLYPFRILCNEDKLNLTLEVPYTGEKTKLV